MTAVDSRRRWRPRRVVRGAGARASHGRAPTSRSPSRGSSSCCSSPRCRRCSWPRAGSRRSGWSLATLVGGAAGGRQREHPELLSRPRHRRGHAPHRAAAAGDRCGHARGRRWSSGSCSASLVGRLAGRRRSTWLSAVLALAAIAFYVFVYTMVLKRRTPQNIVWGGAAGCMPVLIGWSAVTGSLAWTPVVLFARHLLLDAAALLAAVAALPRRLRSGRGADAPGRRRRRRGRPGRSSPTAG